jgi:hypothetical protein
MSRRWSTPSSVVVFALPIAMGAVVACDRGSSNAIPAAQTSAASAGALPDSYRYTPPQPVGSYPSPYAKIQSWINAGNMKAIRAHGWDIWASITAPTPYERPTWQTWYSGHEIFDSIGVVLIHARARHGVVDPTLRPDFAHRPALVRPANGGIPFDPAERVFAFNRFSQSTAQFIWNNRLNYATTLRDTNAAFTKNGTPLVSRAILTSKDSTDSSSFVLKPVFQFISGSEVSAVPYWAGDSTAVTTDSANPIASTWNRAVAVDPSGKFQPGDSVFLPVNNAGPMWLKVVPLSYFYWIKITKDDSINFTMFGASNGDFIGVANDTSLQAVLNAVRPGNIGLLMAMHVTGKEIPNWTWQSFWWGENPNDPQFGADRPKSIPAPWNHYNMTVAYSMTTPNGQPLVAFNPYLETSLAGKIPNEGKTGPDSISWTGVGSNCMACHRRAAIAYVGANPVPQLYGPAMFVSDSDSIVFTQPYPGLPKRVPLLKTDFLWSVAIRARPLPQTQSPATKRAKP